MTEKQETIAVTGVGQIHVTGDVMRLVLERENGSSLVLSIPAGTDLKMADIIVAGLQQRDEPSFDQKAGHVLAAGELQPAQIQKKLTAQGIEEKFLLQAKAEAGTTSLTFRLSPASVRRWIDGAEAELARKGRRPKTSS